MREAIQTKGHTKPLTLSELVSESGKGPLQRAVAIARAHPECRIRLLSFGPYGQELLDAWRGPSGAGERVQAKLDRTGFKAADIAPLFTRLTLESTDEASESNNLSLDLVRLHVVIASIGLLSLPWNGGIRRLIHPNRAVPAASPQR